MMKRFNSEDPLAFITVHDTLYPGIYHYARSFVNAEKAAFITADAFYHLWMRQKNFKHLQSIRIYLQVTVRLSCLNQFRPPKAA